MAWPSFAAQGSVSAEMDMDGISVGGLGPWGARAAPNDVKDGFDDSGGVGMAAKVGVSVGVLTRELVDPVATVGDCRGDCTGARS